MALWVYLIRSAFEQDQCIFAFVYAVDQLSVMFVVDVELYFGLDERQLLFGMKHLKSTEVRHMLTLQQWTQQIAFGESECHSWEESKLGVELVGVLVILLPQWI